MGPLQAYADIFSAWRSVLQGITFTREMLQYGLDQASGLSGQTVTASKQDLIGIDILG